MSLLSEFEEIERKKDDIVLSVAIELYSELVKSTPVDSGNLKASWISPKKTNDGYIIQNTALYASIVLAGRRVVRGKTYGSLQMSEGVEPIIEKYNNMLQIKLKAIK